MIRGRVRKCVYAEEREEKKGKEIGVLYAGSPIAWVVHGVERSMGCRDRLICEEGRVRAGLAGAAHWLNSFSL